MLERHSLNDFAEVVRAVEPAPFRAGARQQFEDHGKRRLARETALGLGGPEAHRGEAASNIRPGNARPESRRR